MLFTRPAIQQRLEQAFERRQAAVLAEVIEAAYADLVKTSDFNELKAIVRELAAAQARTEARVEELAAAQARTEARVEELAAAQARTEARVEELAAAQARTEARVEELAAAQARTEARLEELAAAQARTEEELRTLVRVVSDMQETQKRMLNELAAMKGTLLETRYRDRAGSYWGAVLRRVKAFLPADLEERLEPHLSASDYLDWLEVDLVVRGRPTDRPEAEVWLAVEVSSVVDQGDVQRAARRAGYLRRAGYPAVPAAAGEQATEGAKRLAEEDGVALFLDGRAAFWEPALERALAG